MKRLLIMGAVLMASNVYARSDPVYAHPDRWATLATITADNESLKQTAMSLIEEIINQNENLHLIAESDNIPREITLLVIIDEIKRADGTLIGYFFNVVSVSPLPVMYDVLRLGNTDVAKNLKEHEQLLDGQIGVAGNLSKMREKLTDIVNLALSRSITTINASKEAYENSLKER